MRADGMRAIVQEKYGTPDVFKLREVDKPEIKDDEVLLRVRAAGVNPADWHSMTGTPYLVRVGGGFLRPKNNIPGLDLAGTVEAVGRQVTKLQPGDDVFGEVGRGYAEYATARQDRVVKKPANLSFEQAAAVPVAAFTALQGLRDKGGLQPGQQVLVIGASGGVGTFAVQIAKSMGAEVTGVCSTRNVAMVRSIGADHVVDYTTDDVRRGRKRYDVVLDAVGNHTLRDCRRLLTPTGVYVAVGGPKKSLVLLGRMLAMLAASLFGKRKVVAMLARPNEPDLLTLQELLASGAVTPVVDRTYQLADTAAALRHQGEGHAQGKTVITI